MSKIELPKEKHVGHLTLLRRARTITPKEFNALSFAERLEIVRLSDGRAKYNLILEAADGRELVRALPAQDIYVLIKDLGMEDVSELIALASAEQVTSFIDLDAWDRDSMDGSKALKWLVLALEEGEESILQRFRELDFQMLVLILQKFLTVTQGLEVLLDEDAMQEGAGAGNIYQVRFRDSESAKVIGEMLDILYRRDQAFYMQLMEGVRSELSSLLEEDVFQERSLRLMDLGFPHPDEVMEIYARIDPRSFDPALFDRSVGLSQMEGTPPGFVLTVGRARNLLAQVFEAGVSENTAWELSFLLNKAMVADSVDMGERSQVQGELEIVYGYLNLALEQFCGNDVQKAAALFDRTYLLALFRFGFNLTLTLQSRASEVRRSTVGPYLDGPYAALVSALMSPKPLYFSGLEEGGRPAVTRPFASLEEVERCSIWLEEIEAQRRLFEKHFSFDLPGPDDLDLAGCLPDDARQITLSDFFLTALANRICGRPFLPQPVPREDLQPIHEKVNENRRIASWLRRETLTWIDTLESQAASFVEFCLEIWDEEFCPLDPDQLDPRYIGGLIIRMS
ncbi:MAG: DUF6178 family protein [Syntrophotaleaceae bacterium]